jgi:hypothetical protein
MKFAVGDKVVEKSLIRARTSFPVYQIVGLLDGCLLAKFWGDGFDGEIEEDQSRSEFDQPGSRCWREGIIRYQEDELFSAEEAIAEWRRLGEEKSKLDEEFQTLKAKIQDRMNKAAVLVKESQDMAESVGKELTDAYKECQPLFKSLRESGWTPSSMSC